MKKSTKRALRLAISLAFLVYAAPLGAAVLSAELRVNGLSCPFCAFGIEKKLLDVDGVESVEVFLDEGRLALTFEADNHATVSDLSKAVGKAGFELAGLQLTVRGELVDANEGAALLVANSRLRFRLVEKGPSTGTLERLLGSARAGGSVVVRGAVADWDDPAPTLTLLSEDNGEQ